MTIKEQKMEGIYKSIKEQKQKRQRENKDLNEPYE